MTNRRIFRTAGAADFLGISESWLEKLRLRGTGPRCIRLGHRAVLYDVQDLESWLDRHREPANRRVKTRRSHDSFPPDAA